MTKIAAVIKNKETNCFRFIPDKSFYNTININQKRWGMIYRGEIEPTISELKRIANFFDVEITELINK